MLHAAAMEEKHQQAKAAANEAQLGIVAMNTEEQVDGDTAAAFFETGVGAKDSDCDDNEVQAIDIATAKGEDGDGESSSLLGVGSSKTDDEQTTDNSVWEPDRLLA